MRAHLKKRVDDYLERRSDRIGPQQAYLPGDERFYFPAMRMPVARGTVACCWSKALNTSMPRVDVVSLGELLGEPLRRGGAPRDLEYRHWGDVRFEDLFDLIGDHVVWQAGRAFFKSDDWPSEEWIAAHALTDAEAIALGLRRMGGAR